MFLVFEGVDGCGKSTQCRLLADYLETDCGREVLRVREPGGTELGERIRPLILEPGVEELSCETELFLFMAARSHLVKHQIQPALQVGKVVISDRFIWSSAAYQGTSELSLDAILEVGRLAIDDLRVTRTFLIDLDPAVALGRTSAAADRMEDRGLTYQQSVRANFLELARRFPEAVTIIDGCGSAQEVHRQVVERLVEG